MSIAIRRVAQGCFFPFGVVLMTGRVVIVFLAALAVMGGMLSAGPATGPGGIVVAYTHLQPDGNRWMPGRGTMPRARALDVPLTGEPRWVVAVPLGPASLWVVALADGRMKAVSVITVPIVGARAELVSLVPGRRPSGAPPHLKVEAGVATLVVAPDRDASPLTHPVIFNPSGGLAYVTEDGVLVVVAQPGRQRLPLAALPDARVLSDGSGRLLLLTDATRRYGHGVLGDAIEAGAITLIDTRQAPKVSATIAISAPGVVEGIAPIWADLTGDGLREIVVSVSDAKRGARVQVFTEAGRLIAAGPAFEQGFRWRHPIAVAPFGPRGERELAVVRTPHLGGVVEFYRLEGGNLRVVAELSGHTSHVLGSRNLDMGAAGDFDGDGRPEVLLPNQALDTLGAVRRTANGATVAWTMPLGGRLSSNLSAVTLDGGRLAVGAGRADGVLRIWMP